LSIAYTTTRVCIALQIPTSTSLVDEAVGKQRLSDRQVSRTAALLQRERGVNVAKTNQIKSYLLDKRVHSVECLPNPKAELGPYLRGSWNITKENRKHHVNGRWLLALTRLISSGLSNSYCRVRWDGPLTERSASMSVVETRADSYATRRCSPLADCLVWTPLLCAVF